MQRVCDAVCDVCNEVCYWTDIQCDTTLNFSPVPHLIPQGRRIMLRYTCIHFFFFSSLPAEGSAIEYSIGRVIVLVDAPLDCVAKIRVAFQRFLCVEKKVKKKSM